MADDAKATVFDGGGFEVFPPAPSNIVRPESRFDSMPCGKELSLCRNILRSGGSGLDDLQARAEMAHNYKYTVSTKLEDQKSRTITMKSTPFTVTATIPDYSVLKKRGGGAMSLLALIIELVNKGGVPDAVPESTPADDITITQYTISFPLDLLTKRGIYSNKRNAKRGFLTESVPLTQIQITWTLNPSTKKIAKAKAPGSGSGPLFWQFLVSSDDKTCSVLLNPFINWKALFTSFSLLPRFWYWLPLNAKKLLEHALELASWPQRMKQIAEKGFFDMGILTVINAIGLPDENCERPTQYVYNPIEKAVRYVNNGNHKAFASDFSLSADGTSVGEGYHMATLKEEGKMTGVRIYFGGTVRHVFAGMTATIQQKNDAKRRRRLAKKVVEGKETSNVLSHGPASPEN